MLSGDRTARSRVLGGRAGLRRRRSRLSGAQASPCTSIVASSFGAVFYFAACHKRRAGHPPKRLRAAGYGLLFYRGVIRLLF